ncbi:MAG: hydrogenase small subunit [Nitrospirae bacterium]|nr:hydrogenase small subunit [Nitrospirota bacterium]
MSKVSDDDRSIWAGLARKGVSRRDFIKFCSTMAAALALPSSVVPKIVDALEKKQKPYVLWLEFQDCAGDSESILRATKPTIAEMVLDVISLDYHETIMAGAGKAAEKARDDVVKNQKGKYIAIIEGAIPMNDGGVYCTIAGRTAIDIAKEVCGNAAMTLNVGSCSSWGGIASAKPNPTGAVGVGKAVSGITYVNLPGCPMNVENVTATIVHYLTFGALPALDGEHRPLFAHGQIIHNNCERRAHFDAGQFVRQWGDYGHRHGWCLYQMGCKGPEAHFNCPTIRWNGGTNWPVRAGHPCFACASTNNWDAYGPLYSRLENVPGAGYQTTADKIGLAAVAVTAAGVAIHAVGRAIKGQPKEEEKK